MVLLPCSPFRLPSVLPLVDARLHGRRDGRGGRLCGRRARRAAVVPDGGRDDGARARAGARVALPRSQNRGRVVEARARRGAPRHVDPLRRELPVLPPISCEFQSIDVQCGERRHGGALLVARAGILPARAARGRVPHGLRALENGGRVHRAVGRAEAFLCRVVPVARAVCRPRVCARRPLRRRPALGLRRQPRLGDGRRLGKCGRDEG